MDLGLNGRTALVGGASAGSGGPVPSDSLPKAAAWSCGRVGAMPSSLRPGDPRRSQSRRDDGVRRRHRSRDCGEGCRGGQEGSRQGRDRSPQRRRAASRRVDPNGSRRLAALVPAPGHHADRAYDPSSAVDAGPRLWTRRLDTVVRDTPAHPGTLLFERLPERACRVAQDDFGRGHADGVTVNGVLPGRLDTKRIASLDLARAERSGTTQEAVRADTPSGSRRPIRRPRRAGRLCPRGSARTGPATRPAPSSRSTAASFRALP